MKNLVIVDVQPEYSPFPWSMNSFCDYIEAFSCDNILVLYNGEWTLAMINEEDLIEYYASIGCDRLVNEATFFDKGYAFFRNCMDEGFADEVIIPVIQYMWNSNIRDSRNINWNDVAPEILSKLNPQIIEFLQSEEMMCIPDLMEVLSDLKGDIHLVGGAQKECLREVVLALEVLKLPYTIDQTYVY